MKEKWKKWIEQWVQAGDLPEEFYEAAIVLARNCLRETDSNFQESLELVNELLAILRQQHGRMIETKTLFYREMKRLAIRWNRSADEVDLRDVLRRAVNTLEGEGRIRRVDEMAGSRNENHVTWSSTPTERDGLLFDPIAFQRDIARLKKRFRTPWKSDTGARREKILSLGKAKELLLELLALAKGPVPFRDLFDATSVLVEMPRRAEVERWEDVCQQGLLNPSENLIVEESVQAITDSVWQRVIEADVKEALCGYVIRKFLHGDSSTLRALGKPQRMHEAVKLVHSILATELNPKEFASTEGIAAAVASGVFQRLEQKCSENRSH